MGDTRLIPYLSPEAKAKVDVVAVPSTLLGWFQFIPWADVAAALACIYTALRILEALPMLWHAWRRKK